jgi:glutamine amidotransferase
MCELMGLCFAKAVSADFSVREFALRDHENADGWGLAWYPDQSVAVIKEPIPWRASQHTQFLERYQALSSAIYIAHVRHKTVGGPATHADTHPFTRELFGRDYCFAHNGTLLGLCEPRRRKRFWPVGATDSEAAFCQLLDELWERGDDLSELESWRWLHGRLSAFNRLGKINCLMSDGRRLFCYHDSAGHKGLTFCRMHVNRQQAGHFEDQELEVELEDASMNYGYAVATHPLNDAAWQRFQPGELIVLENGTIRFSSHRAAGQETSARVVAH